MKETVDRAECIWPLSAELAEGPVWRAGEEAVWFVDIKKRQVHRLHVPTGERRSWAAPEQIGFIAPVRSGGWIVGLQSGLARFDPETGGFSTPLPLPAHPATNRLNDGYVDADGRLWFGSMDDGEVARAGALYRLTPDGSAAVQDTGYRIANGPAASPDGRVLYHTDTADRIIYAFDVDENGGLSGKREFVRITRPGAHPDGLCVDSEGGVWTALFGGWGVERYSPKGERIERIELPVANVTKPAFGGPDLTTLYLTTARLHLDEAQQAAQPLAGGLFRVAAGVGGLPHHEVSIGV